MIRPLSTLLLMIIGHCPVWAQMTYTIDDFSEEYYAKVYLQDPAAVFSPGWIAVYDNAQHGELLKVSSEELALALHDGKVQANIRELPYGEQSVLQYLDVNFDGIKDLAIEDGQNSCYHGPSFQVYLGRKGGFSYSEAFSRLAQEYCGMFEVEAAEKRIYTMMKSGCCWHQLSAFAVVNNVPKVMEIVEEDYSGGRHPFGTMTRQSWNGKEMVSHATEIVDINELTVQYRFTVEHNDKTLTLFTQDNTLYYVLQDTAGAVELSFPKVSAGTSDFIYNAGRNTLQFKNKEVLYTIYETDDACGIRIYTGEKGYDWTGRSATQKGHLKDLSTSLPENVMLVP